jgi:hypothetical protein
MSDSPNDRMETTVAKKRISKTHEDSDCVLPPPPIPAEEVGRYGVERDVYSEMDIQNYVEGQARDEAVQHVERVKTESILGKSYEIWDVTTDKNRWWVLTNLTNLYSQKYFPSLDYTLSFHVGLMARMRNRPQVPDSSEPHPFDDVFRREQQATERHDTATEAEHYQAVGLHLRECLIALAGVLRRRVQISKEIERPQDANFVDWTDVLMNQLCPGTKNGRLRTFLKRTAKDTWQLVNWLTHDRNASATASTVAIQATRMVIGHCIEITLTSQNDKVANCPGCSSRQVRSHFDLAIGSDGDYFSSCRVCGWTDHPTKGGTHQELGGSGSPLHNR